MIKRKVLLAVLENSIGKLPWGSQAGFLLLNSEEVKQAQQVYCSLDIYVSRRELNLNLDGKELYDNAKKCLEQACYEVESYE